VSSPDVAEILAQLRASGRSLAVAESLTGGLLAATLTGVAGASDVFRGGIVAYATDLKQHLLDVPADLLVEFGPVHVEVAAAMAEGVRLRLGSDLGLATTGVAGPDPQGGHAPGLVYLAIAGPEGTITVRELFSGDRSTIRALALGSALALLAGYLA
jgi:nicotinamide-nucleotide amidase